MPWAGAVAQIVRDQEGAADLLEASERLQELPEGRSQDACHRQVPQMRMGVDDGAEYMRGVPPRSMIVASAIPNRGGRAPTA